VASLAQAIRAGSAYVELALRDKLSAGLDAAGRKLKSWGAGITSIGVRVAAVGGGITAVFGAALSHFIETGSALNDMSDRTGVSVEA
jgi:hypothetical protein